MENFINELYYRLTNRERVYINAYVERGKSTGMRNWGDDINYWFLKEIIKNPIRLFNESPIAFRRNEINYLVIGSTISLLTKNSTIIWGAGCIDERPLPAKPKKVLAVRGPLTRKYLTSIGVECPEIYGDPAMLLPYFYKPMVEKKYKIGLIRHSPEKPVNIDGCHMIYMTSYSKWTDIIDEICSCEVIASSSLHGLIVAEAYGIPNIWTASEQVYGGHFKFHDFFLSIGEDRKCPMQLFANTTIGDLLKNAEYTSAHSLNLEPLISAAPFQLKNLTHV